MLIRFDLRYRILFKTLLIILLITTLYVIFSQQVSEKPYEKTDEKPHFRGFGWYGYLADDEINVENLEKIKELRGNSVNINVYYEYSTENATFILKSNLTKIKENIDLSHQYDLNVFLSPFANLVGGHYLANAIEKDVESYLDGARNISIQLAKFSQENDVEIYAIWNEMGLSLIKIPNSTNVVNEWIQDTREDVTKVYDGVLTTKEGVQTGLYRTYNFSDFDYVGVTFYPFTTSHYTDPYTGMDFGGVENLEEYEEVVEEEFNYLMELKQKFKNEGIILGEIGIDVVGGDFVRNDEEGKKIRRKAYEIVLTKGQNKTDGFFFSKFEYEDGGSAELDYLFKTFFL